MSEITDEEIVRMRRIRQLAVATLNRAREGGIPEKYMRVKCETFAEVLDPNYHGGPKVGVPDFAKNIYHNPDFLLKRSFIAIDGGNEASRTLAGYAILFRIIAYDKYGQYWNCESLGHKFQTINATEGIRRNDLADELKGYDCLFISEFDKYRFKPQFEHGSFFDEILADRVNYERPTIVSFVNPISLEPITESNQAEKALNGELDCGCGRQLMNLGLVPQTTNSVLRVRVKKIVAQE